MKTSNTNFSDKINRKYDIYEFRHASTLLRYDFPEEHGQLVDLLDDFEITYEDITTPGGRKSPIAKKFDDALYKKGWVEKYWDIDIVIDGVKHPSPTHKVDYFKNKVAVELEWNNKDPFYDRDLNNFRLLHQLDVISVGVIVTRADELQSLFVELEKGSSYGASTTRVGKLLPKIVGGGAAETPLLVFAITKEACKPSVKELVDEAKQ
jgi:hypothetical protein